MRRSTAQVWGSDYIIHFSGGLRWAGGLRPPGGPFGPSLASDVWEALCQ